MKLHFENIGGIIKSDIAIDEGVLNIKYGHNGIGKSTLVKAIKHFLGNDGDVYSLKPLAADTDPVCIMTWSKRYDDVLIYDTNYFKMLFSSDDVLNNTYEMIIRDKDYENKINDIYAILNKLHSLTNIKEITDFQKVFFNPKYNYLANWKSNGEPYKKSALKSYPFDGVVLNDTINPDIVQYKRFINSGFRSDWSKWVIEADSSWYDKRCPYCGRVYKGNTTLKQTINHLAEQIDEKKYRNNDSDQSLINNIAKYAAKNKRKIKSINSYIGVADELLLKPAEECYSYLLGVAERLDRISNLQANDFVKKARDNSKNKVNCIKEFLKSLKIQTSKAMILDDDGNNILKTINNEIDSLILKASGFVSSIEHLKNDITKKIDKNEKIVNEFLKISGIPYKVSINNEGDTLFKCLFSYNCNNSKALSNQLDYLSYGEANAFALLIFALMAKNKNNSLIILDDPVSSFDANKRHAIFNYLFSKDLLLDKTCVLFTHDFNTPVTFAFSYPHNSRRVSFYYFQTTNKVLYEKRYYKSDIISSVIGFQRLAKDKNHHILARATSLRRFFEMFKGKDCDEYNFLSGFIHCLPIPKKGNDDGAQIFNNIEIYNVGGSVARELDEPDFIYSSRIASISNDVQLIDDYHKTPYKYDKLCILRTLLDRKDKEIKSENKGVVWNFLCEAFHIEYELLSTIQNVELVDIPEYIIHLCDEIVDSI